MLYLSFRGLQSGLKPINSLKTEFPLNYKICKFIPLPFQRVSDPIAIMIGR